MEQLDILFGKIQKIVGILVKTPDDGATLSEILAELEKHWEDFQQVGKDIRPTLTTSEEIEDLNNAITRTLKAYNVAEQGIKNRLEKLAEKGDDNTPLSEAETDTNTENKSTVQTINPDIMKESASPVEDTAASTSADTQSARTKTYLRSFSEPTARTDVQALHSLLQQLQTNSMKFYRTDKKTNT